MGMKDIQHRGRKIQHTRRTYLEGLELPTCMNKVASGIGLMFIKQLTCTGYNLLMLLFQEM